MHTVLVIAQTPPPFGGQSMMTRRLLDGQYLHARLLHVRMAFSRGLDENRRFKLRKLLMPFPIIARAIWARWRHGATVLYYPPAGPDLLPMLRDVLVLVCLRWMFRRTVFHYHAAGVCELAARLPAPLRLLYRWAYFGAELAIQTSEFNPPDGAQLQARRVTVVPNGIEDDYAALGSPPRPERAQLTLLFIGLVSESKGIFVLIDAVALLRAQGLAPQVVVVGPIETADTRRRIDARLAELGLGASFEFTGILTGADKHRRLLDADVLCFPTYFESESFGLVAVEGMQFALPVVATRWRGVQSVVVDGDTGFLVPPRDAESFAARLQILVEQPDLRRRMGARGRERYLAEYTLARFRARMDECFSQL
jgi:glycosyltransferase involved in cell wall biosynthesis